MAQKTFHRADRVGAQLRRELGELVHAAMREHALPSVSVSDVEVTRDLAHAKVFVTALQSERASEAVQGLKALAPEIRYQLGRRMQLRHVPELHFHYDDSVDRGERIDNLLRELDRDGDSGSERAVDQSTVDQSVADEGSADKADVSPASSPDPRVDALPHDMPKL